MERKLEMWKQHLKLILGALILVATSLEEPAQSWTGTRMRKGKAPCPLPWGGSIQSGQSVTAYAAVSPSCDTGCASELRTCSGGVLSGSYSGGTSCTVQHKSFSDVGNGNSFNCTASCISGVSYTYVYGTGTYHAYSDICKAAIHAGLITSGGGTVTGYLVSGGCINFDASTQNGIVSSLYDDGAPEPAGKFSGDGVCN